MAPDWAKHAIFYQIFPDRFARSRDDKHLTRRNLEPWDAPPTVHGYKGGTLRGIRDRLEYLKDLGVDVLYLNPIFQSASNHRYHTTDYYRVDPLLGGDEAFAELLAAAKRAGFRVVLDCVFNHVGRGFFQFNDLIENGPGSPWVDWFRVESWPIQPYDTRRPGYACWHSLPALPQLNHDNAEVREYLYRVADYWTAKGIDGWRLDTPDCIATPGFWEEFRARVLAINPEAYIVGEVVSEAPDWVGGERCDGLINYPLHGAIVNYAGRGHVRREFLKRQLGGGAVALDGVGFAKRLRHLIDLYPWEATLGHLNFLETHDSSRFLTVVGGHRPALRTALMLLFTLPGIPCIYYGGEVGLEGGHDPDCRRAFPDEAEWDREVLALHRAVIALRRDHVALRTGTLVLLGAKGHMTAYARIGGDEAVVVAVNGGARTTTARLDTAGLGVPGSARLLFGGGRFRWEDGALVVELPPGDGAVIAL